MTINSTTSRIVSISIALVVLTIMGWGLFWLHDIFRTEHQQSLQAMADRQQALQSYAQARLDKQLAQVAQRTEQRIQLAADDPLLPAQDLLWLEQGEQRLPRRWPDNSQPRPSTTAASAPQSVADKRHGKDIEAERTENQKNQPAKMALQDKIAVSSASDHKLDLANPTIAAAKSLETEANDKAPSAPQQQALDLLAQLHQALDLQDRDAISQATRALLGHSARFHTDPAFDLDLLCQTAQALQNKSTPSPELLRGLLLEGLGDRRGHYIAGLQRQLLNQRAALNAQQFTRISQCILQQSKQAALPIGQFQQRLADTLSVAPILADQQTEGFVGDWWLFKRGDTVFGTQLQSRQVLTQLAQQLQATGLLGQAEQLQLATPASLALIDAQAEQRQATLTRNYRLKTSLLIASSLLLLGLFVAGALSLQRQQRWLQLKEEFITTVSHELRTPLASIRLMTETLEARLPADGPAKDYPQRLLQDVDKLGFLVENLLSFNRLNAGRWPLHLSSIQLTDLQHMLEDQLPMYSQQPFTIQTQGQLDVQADPDLLRLLILNLGRNACQYSDQPQTQLQLEGYAQKLLLRDNSRGLSQDQWQKVFTPFERGQGQDNQSGSGLGLALCAKIMKLHGGNIRIIESSPTGSTFELIFPA